MASSRPCTFPGCAHLVNAHDLCKSHGKQLASGRALAPLGTYRRGPRTFKPKPHPSLPVGMLVWLVRDGVRDLRQVVGYRGRVVLLDEVAA